MRKYNHYFDRRIVLVPTTSLTCDEDDTDEYIEHVIEEGRKEYYKAWIEYVREYD